jgi:hypothetical protein
MSDFGVVASTNRFDEDDAAGSGAYKMTVSSSASANVKGGWTTISASCPFDASAILLTVNINSPAFLIDIGVGAGSIQVLVPNISVFVSPIGPFAQSVVLPVGIPAGTAVSIRIQASTGSQSLNFKLHFLAASFLGLSSLQTAVDYGANTASSIGTKIISNVTTTAKGAWVQLTASATHDIRGVLFCFSQFDINYYDFNVDLGVGANGSEQAVISDLYIASTTGGSNNTITPSFLYLPIVIPAGSRITARCKCSTGSASLYVSIVGFS